MKCPCCNGTGTKYPDPANSCGYCDDEGKVGIWKYIRWKFSEKFLWK